MFGFLFPVFSLLRKHLHTIEKKRTWHLRQLKWKTLISGLSKNTRREIDNDKANR